VELVGWGLLAVIAALVVVPLAREYRDFRRALGLGPLGALGTTALLLPSFAIGLVLSLPLGAHPEVQWLATVLATLVAYSLAVRGVEEVLEASPEREPARPR
jgi:hypothetical protein